MTSNQPSHLYFPSHQKKRSNLLLRAAHRAHLTPDNSTETDDVLIESPTNTEAPSSGNKKPLNASRRKSMTSNFFKRQFFSNNYSSSDQDSFDSDNSLTPTIRHAANTMARRARLPSLHRSCDSTDSSNSSSNASGELSAGKTNYRIIMLGACSSGKTSIVRQFLYDKFAEVYVPTACDDMYRGEFEIHDRAIGFDIQDVSGNYVYEFPGMRNVSLASADAFVIVFSLDNEESWEEVSRLRDMIHQAKDTDVPIVVVGNKSDLVGGEFASKAISQKESIEAVVTFDWENGYVESSAKERKNINKIFKELLQQAKSKYDFTSPVMSMQPQNVALPSGKPSNNNALSRAPNLPLEDNLKRRQSLPAVPAGFKMGLNKMHSKPHHGGDQLTAPVASTASPKGVKRRSSLAALRRDSCKIS